MLDAARDIELYTQGRSKQKFEEDRILRLALTTLFQTIGEAARRISEEFKNEHPEFQWIRITGFRNRLVHGYDVIDYDVMWDIITADVPVLLKNLRALNLA